MKQTVFKGVVNGVEYDSVEKYNEAVNDALKKGLDIKASSSTEIKDVQEETDEQIKKIFPFHKIDDVIKFVDDHADDFNNAVETLCQTVSGQLTEYAKDTKKSEIIRPNIEKYYKTLGEKLDKYEVDLDKLTDELAELEDRYDKLTDIVDTLDALYEVYGEVLDDMDEDKYKDDKVEEENCRHNCDNCKCKTKEQDKNDSFINDFMKLLSKIK